MPAAGILGWKRSKYWKHILHSSRSPETPRKSFLELIRIIERRKYQRGPTPKFDCVKSFMDTDAFRGFSTKYGLDSEIVASICESFATQVDLPKEKWFKYNHPIEVKVVAPIQVEEKTITYNDHIVLTAYIENHLSLLE